MKIEGKRNKQESMDNEGELKLRPLQQKNVISFFCPLKIVNFPMKVKLEEYELFCAFNIFLEMAS